MAELELVVFGDLSGALLAAWWLLGRLDFKPTKTVQAR